MQAEFAEMKMSRDKVEEEMAKLREIYDNKISAAGIDHVPSPGQAGALPIYLRVYTKIQQAVNIESKMDQYIVKV